MKQKFAFLLVCGLILSGIAVGYRMKGNNEVNKMLSYMEYKYGEEFNHVESYAGQPGKPYITMLVERKSNPNQVALVRVRSYNGRRYYEDNFLAYLLMDELEEKVMTLAEKSFGKCKLYYKIPVFVFPGEFRADMSAEDFLQNPYAMAQFYIYPKSASKDKDAWEKKLQSFINRNAGEGYQIRGTLSLPASEDNYEMIQKDNFAESDYLGYEAFGELVFSMDHEGKTRYVRWINK